MKTSLHSLTWMLMCRLHVYSCVYCKIIWSRCITFQMLRFDNNLSLMPLGTVTCKDTRTAELYSCI